MFFLDKIKNIVDFEKVIKENPFDINVLRDAKVIGFSDKFIGQLWGESESGIYLLRKKHDIRPVYKMIDSCGAEFHARTNYFYSSYEWENESIPTDRRKIIVLGSGPIRIGQGVEFDYSTVHAVWTIRQAGFEAIVINNNPETVSTDHTTGDKLYFEPLTVEEVMNVIDLERPEGGHSLAWRTDSHQPCRTLGGSRRTDNRHRHHSHQKRGRPRMLRSHHGEATDTSTRRCGCNQYRGWSEGSGTHRLSSACATQLRAWRTRHADSKQRA